MELVKMEDDLKIIQNLSTFPNADDGLTPEELKGKFDLAGQKIQQYLNEQVVPAVRGLQGHKSSFYVTVNSDQNGGFVMDKTMDELHEAYNAGRLMYCNHGTLLPLATVFSDSTNSQGYMFQGIQYGTTFVRVRIDSDGIVVETSALAKTGDALRNPQKLILTGAVEAEYDGSAEVTVEIPEGGSGGSAEVHIGSDEPTGDEVVWINAEGDADGGFIPAPATAEVGQTIVVKAVDEDGKPTEWECADVATGGSGALEHIRTIELTEEVAQIVVDTDADGNALNLSNIVLAIYTVGGTNNTATSTYYCYPNSINAGAIRFANENGVYAAGKTVRSIVDITLLDTGTYYTRHGVSGSSAMKWNRYGSEASIKSVTLYLDTDSYTFGVGTKIVVSGVWK